MKCEYCSGTLSLEDEYCPHCGQPNKHAKQHIKDMRRYQGEFEDTKNYVYEKTGRYTDISVRVVIMAVLIVLIIIVFLLGVNVWEIRYNWRSASADRHYSDYSQILDEYLEEERYLEFYSFCSEKGIRYYEGAYGEKYGLVMQLCNSYANLYNALFDYFTFEEGDSLNYVVEMTSDSLDYFYKYYLDENHFYTDLYGDSDLFRQAADVMEYNVEQMLITYGSFTQEEAASMSSLSKTKRAVLIEEKLEAGMQNE